MLNKLNINVSVEKHPQVQTQNVVVTQIFLDFYDWVN